MIDVITIKSMGYKHPWTCPNLDSEVELILFKKGNCEISQWSTIPDRWRVVVDNKIDRTEFFGKIKNKYELKKIVKFLKN